MQLENTFTIAAPIDKAWEALNTPTTVAPCFPGAALESYEGDSFTGTVKVKLGPISLTYKGKGTYKSRDDEAKVVVIEASGRDSRGNGTASATVTGSMKSDGPDKTSVTMVTDMTITGRPAQFGRGVMSDVADKIIGQFASCVADKLAPQPAAAEGAAAEGAAAPAAAAQASGSTNGSGAAATATKTATGPALTSTPAAAAASTPAPAQMRSEIDAIDLLDTAGAPVLKRLAPVIGGGLLLILIVVLLRRRRRS
ncbi:SRPBCC family protein [Pseudonocardia sp.]|uniref:SRPBCC family protein n=1 Tax=Pseudonocardia sp. TaxID=60912 RepID=UPI003D096614